MKYYTEGFVKTITVRKETTMPPDNCPIGQLFSAKPTTITIEPIQPFKFEQDCNNFIIFVDGKEKSGEAKRGNDVRKASMVNTTSNFACETFDAQFILSLKQSRTRVRFYVDNPNDKSPKITEIIVL